MAAVVVALFVSLPLAASLPGLAMVGGPVDREVLCLADAPLLGGCVDWSEAVKDQPAESAGPFGPVAWNGDSTIVYSASQTTRQNGWYSTIHAIEVETQTILWSSPMLPHCERPTQSCVPDTITLRNLELSGDGSTVVATAVGRGLWGGTAVTFAFDAATGAARWEDFTLADPPSATRWVFVDVGMAIETQRGIVVVSGAGYDSDQLQEFPVRDHELTRALNASTGELLWETKTRLAEKVTSPSVIHTPTVTFDADAGIAYTFGNALVAQRVETGEILWTRQLPRLGGNGSGEGGGIAFDSATQRLVALVTDGERVLAHLLNPHDGATLGAFLTEERAARNLDLGDGGVAYISGVWGITKIDLAANRIAWFAGHTQWGRGDTGAFTPEARGAVEDAAHGIVYVATDVGNSALDIATGDLLWESTHFHDNNLPLSLSRWTATTLDRTGQTLLSIGRLGDASTLVAQHAGVGLVHELAPAV